MKRNRSQLATRSLTDELAELRRLDLSALKQRWRALYRSEAPVHIGHALLLHAVALPAAGDCSRGPQTLHAPPARADRRR
jgi:hypothetical protein